MTSHYTSPLLQIDGATELPDSDAPLLPEHRGVAWHYGDPLVEQRRLDERPGWIDRSHRRVLRVSGPDAPVFLNNLLSQKLDDVPPGFASPALDLDMQGHILHHLDVLRAYDTDTGEPTFLIHVPAAQEESLRTFLERMIFWSKVEITPADLGVLTLLGEGSHALLRSVLDDARTRSELVGAPIDWRGRERADLLLARAELPALIRLLEERGAGRAGLMAFTAERVRALEPELGVDLDHRSIPHEVPHWIGRGSHPGAVHLHKGCYRGQETVARVENLGRSPRVAVLLLLDGSAPTEPHAGEAILRGQRAVGRLGTVVHDSDYGPIAFALLKRSALGQPGLHVGDTAVAVDPDSLPRDEGERAGRAAVNRLRGR